jgi:tRNA(Arg) A34 adenosine deaminase TadA
LALAVSARLRYIASDEGNEVVGEVDRRLFRRLETLMENHEPFLREAIALSKSALERGDEPFGSVLVKDGEVILRAENSVFTGHDMTNHAEMNLIKLAAQQYDTAFLADCTLYTSTEPCAMCSGAIYWSGVGRMVYACSESRLGEIAGIGLNVPSRAVLQTGARIVDVVGPILEDEAAEVHQEFWPKHLSKA